MLFDVCTQLKWIYLGQLNSNKIIYEFTNNFIQLKANTEVLKYIVWILFILCRIWDEDVKGKTLWQTILDSHLMCFMTVAGD